MGPIYRIIVAISLVYGQVVGPKYRIIVAISLVDGQIDKYRIKVAPSLADFCTCTI